MRQPSRPHEPSPSHDPAGERLAEFRERVRGISRRDGLDSAAVAVLAAFEAAGVAALLLKGPVLARTLYTADEARGYTDIDLLVAPDDLPQARRVLADLGFRHGSRRGIDDVAGVVNSETWLRMSDGDPPRPLPIDLHWRLAGTTVALEEAWDRLDESRSAIEIEGVQVPALNRAGLAFHLASHAAQHGPRSLKAMADLNRGLERWPLPTWRSAARLAEELGAVATFAAGLRLAPAGATLARDLALPPTDEATWEIENRDLRPRGTFHLRAWREAGGFRERVGILRRSLLPSPDWIRAEYPGAGRGTRRLLLAYARHFARTPAWAFKAWRFRRRARRASS